MNQVTINGLRLNYVRRGHGPPALLLHGYGHAITMWERPLNSYLQAHYACYALDLPGHGASDKLPVEWYTLENFTQIIYQFCLKLNLKKALLIGYSMGGLIGMNLALKHPDLVANLVTINSPIKGEFLAVFDLFLYLEKLARLPFADSLLKFYTRIHWLTWPVESRRYAQAGMFLSQSCKRVRRELAQCTVQSLYGSYRMLRHVDLSQQLADLQPPMLVIVSDQDKVVPPRQSYLISKRARQAQLAVITGSGHLPIDEQPVLFDAALKEYLGMNGSINR